MGGNRTENDNDGKMPAKKNKNNVSEAVISKLLNDFNSAALLRGSLDSNSNASSKVKNVECEEISASLKNLHLRKPANSRQKFKEKKGCSKKGKISKGNKYNLSVAAVNVQRPVVWPGKLNNSLNKEEEFLLQPSRLSIGSKDKELTPLPSFGNSEGTSSGEERSRIASELEKHNMHQFGSFSESSQHRLSFSSLSYNDSDAEKPSPSESQNLVASSSTAKRPTTSSTPAAKHRRIYNEIYAGSDIAQCLDYRSSYSHEDTNQTERYPLSPGRTTAVGEESLSSEKNKLCTASCLPSQVPSTSSERAGSLAAADCSVERTSGCNCDDIGMDESNVNELASYLDDFLHIPKKMSVMAEMMYA